MHWALDKLMMIFNWKHRLINIFITKILLIPLQACAASKMVKPCQLDTMKDEVVQLQVTIRLGHKN